MDNKYHSLLTRIGIEKLTRAQVEGTQVKLTEMAVGDMDREPNEDMTSLGNEVWRGEINDMGVDPLNPSWIYTETHIPENIGGFWVREAGIYDDEGDLIVISRQPASYKPMLEDGTAKQLIIRIITEVSNADTVELSIDPSIVMASREYVDKQMETCKSLIGDLSDEFDGKLEGKQSQLDLLFSAVNRIMIENELHGKTDGGYGFFDALDGSTPKNMKLSASYAIASKEVPAGSSNFELVHSFAPGEEVTLFDDENYEDVLIQSVDGNTLKLKTPTEHAYKAGAIVARSTTLHDQELGYTTYKVRSAVV